MKLKAIIIAAALIAPAAHAQKYDMSTPYNFETTSIKGSMNYLAESRVADSLKDPDSAKFRKSFEGDGVYCGEVNAKNSFGAYIGWKKWVWNPALTVMQGQVKDKDFVYVWNELCAKK